MEQTEEEYQDMIKAGIVDPAKVTTRDNPVYLLGGPMMGNFGKDYLTSPVIRYA